MNTQPNTISQLFHSALESSSLATRLYLEEAKRADDPIRSSSLEASAVELAIIADQFEAIAQQKFNISPARVEQEPSESLNLSQATKRMLHDCDRLARACNDADVRNLARDLRRSLGGLAEIPRSPFHRSEPSAIST